MHSAQHTAIPISYKCLAISLISDLNWQLIKRTWTESVRANERERLRILKEMDIHFIYDKKLKSFKINVKMQLKSVGKSTFNSNVCLHLTKSTQFKLANDHNSMNGVRRAKKKMNQTQNQKRFTLLTLRITTYEHIKIEYNS